jgi:hypothetical protein
MNSYEILQTGRRLITELAKSYQIFPVFPMEYVFFELV